jgi:hypothetical protein
MKVIWTGGRRLGYAFLGLAMAIADLAQAAMRQKDRPGEADWSR